MVVNFLFQKYWNSAFGVFFGRYYDLSPNASLPLRVCLIKFANHASSPTTNYQFIELQTANSSNFQLIELQTRQTTLTWSCRACFPLIYPNQPPLLTNRTFIANLTQPNLTRPTNPKACFPLIDHNKLVKTCSS